jgi:hemin uptake protein HemP
MLKLNDSRPPEEADGGSTAPAVSSRDLLGDKRELLILHGRERYRLLLTKSNKLILTK